MSSRCQAFERISICVTRYCRVAHLCAMPLFPNLIWFTTATGPEIPHEMRREKKKRILVNSSCPGLSSQRSRRVNHAPGIWQKGELYGVSMLEAAKFFAPRWGGLTWASFFTYARSSHFNYAAGNWIFMFTRNDRGRVKSLQMHLSSLILKL